MTDTYEFIIKYTSVHTGNELVVFIPCTAKAVKTQLDTMRVLYDASKPITWRRRLDTCPF